MLEHMGIRCGYVYLRTISHQGNDETQSLMTAAAEMYLAGKEDRTVKTDSYEGRIYTKKRYEIPGHFGGQRFDAGLDTTYGRDNATFIVNEQTGDGDSGPSLN